VPGRDDVAAREQLPQPAQRLDALLDRLLEEPRGQPQRRHAVTRQGAPQPFEREDPGRHQREPRPVQE
jgi:hypothetical protein